MDSSREDLLFNLGFRQDDVYPDIASLLASDDPNLDEVKRILEQLRRRMLEDDDDGDGGSKVCAALPVPPKRPWGGRRDRNHNLPPLPPQDFKVLKESRDS